MILDPATGHPGGSVQNRHPRLLFSVWLVWSAFGCYSLYRLQEEPFVLVMLAMVIASVALLPALLWSAGYVPGMPVHPTATLTFLWVYALPLAAGQLQMGGQYDQEDFVFATMCIVAFVLSGTLAWFLVGRPSGTPRARFYYVLPDDRGFLFFILAIAAGCWFAVVSAGGLVDFDPRLFGSIRSVILALAALGVFVLGLRLGRGELSRWQRRTFLGMTVGYIFFQLVSLFLVSSIVCAASAIIGFTLGRGRVPWAMILAGFLIFGFLHSGKTEMRQKYWIDDAPAVQIYDMPAFFAEWIVDGADQLTGTGQWFGAQPIYERVSLMHLLLLVVSSTPDRVSYLEGATYAAVPRLLIPRVFDPDKPDSHQGTSMLNIHYGLQTLEETERTTVGWGLLNESVANFGLSGVIGLGVFLGLLFGYVGRATVGAPAMSLQNMIGVIFTATAIQSEFTFGVFATILSQSMIILLLVVPLLEQRRTDKAV
jgi:hypothetical protein